jgi:hypothetical protein
MPEDVVAVVGSSRLYHKPDCHSASRAWNPENYMALESASFCAALDGRSPCELCEPPHDPGWEDLARHFALIKRTENIDIAVMRRSAIIMLDHIFGADDDRKALKARVLDLSRSDRIPIDVANSLHMISDLRNMAEHGRPLTELQAPDTRLCWLLVKDWSATRP